MSASSSLLERLQAVVLLLRIGRHAEACADLPALMGDIASSLEASPAARQEQLKAHFARGLQQWERHDWLGLADTLEVEVGSMQ